MVPEPRDVIALIEEAQVSRSPDKARAIFVAATTGMRRGELCALRRRRDIDWDHGRLTVGWSVAQLPGQPLHEKATKNRRERSVALDDFTLSMLRAQVAASEERAAACGVALVDDAFVFSDAPDGSEPWKPGAVTRYFARLRERVGLEDLDFHYLRKFMETYGQDLGFSPVPVAMRAGHDPSVAARHYTGRLDDADRALSHAVASLLVPEG